MIDKIIQNAFKLGKLVWTVNLLNKRGYFTTQNQEEQYKAYWKIREEQEELLERLK